MAESKPARGGARPGAGRKPKEVTRLRRALAERQAEAAEFAFDLYDATTRDARAPLDLRLDCAREVMNRVWGKPAEKAKVEHSGGLKIEVVYADHHPDAAPAPPGPGGDP